MQNLVITSCQSCRGLLINAKRYIRLSPRDKLNARTEDNKALNWFPIAPILPAHSKEAFPQTFEAIAGLYRDPKFQRKHGPVRFQDLIRSVRSMTV